MELIFAYWRAPTLKKAGELLGIPGPRFREITRRPAFRDAYVVFENQLREMVSFLIAAHLTSDLKSLTPNKKIEIIMRIVGAQEHNQGRDYLERRVARLEALFPGLPDISKAAGRRRAREMRERQRQQAAGDAG